MELMYHIVHLRRISRRYGNNHVLRALALSNTPDDYVGADVQVDRTLLERFCKWFASAYRLSDGGYDVDVIKVSSCCYTVANRCFAALVVDACVLLKAYTERT